MLRRVKDGVKLLGKGELTTKLNIVAYDASGPARAAVEAAGGALTLTKKVAASEG